VTFPVLVTAKV
jgi:hypothetical protein